MNSKRKNDGNKQIRRVAKEKLNPVAENSMQTKAPGAGPPERGNEQSNRTQAPSIENRGSQQGGVGGLKVGERGGVGAQQTGWSARQQAERMKARAEEARRGEPQQSGYGGAEQYQHAGSHESPTAPARSPETSAAPKEEQAETKLPPTDSGSKRST